MPACLSLGTAHYVMNCPAAGLGGPVSQAGMGAGWHRALEFTGTSPAESLKTLDNGGACPGPMASMYYG